MVEAEHAELSAEREQYLGEVEELEALRAEAAKWAAERNGLNVRIAELEGRLAPAVCVNRLRGGATRLGHSAADTLRRKTETNGAHPPSEEAEEDEDDEDAADARERALEGAAEAQAKDEG